MRIAQYDICNTIYAIMKTYLGIDVGAVSTDLAIIDENRQVLDTLYIWTDGNPIKATQKGLREIRKVPISGIGVTGSARRLVEAIFGADIVKTEIIAHAVAAQYFIPEVRTIIEIGGQDSKIIILRNGVIVDFAMNSICAAGCGAFLDYQAKRLNIPIENFGLLALKSKSMVNIAGRCTVFAESDMIHKQQIGHPVEDIICGLCEAIVRNYLNNVGKGKKIESPIVFQGGVAANQGVREAFERELGQEIIVPKYFKVMGAIGSALLALERKIEKSRFKGFNVANIDLVSSSFTCSDCANHCEIIVIENKNEIIARWGSKCGKWNT